MQQRNPGQVGKPHTTQKAAKASLAEYTAKYPHRNYELRSWRGDHSKLVVVCTNPGLDPNAKGGTDMARREAARAASEAEHPDPFEGLV